MAVQAKLALRRRGESWVRQMMDPLSKRLIPCGMAIEAAVGLIVTTSDQLRVVHGKGPRCNEVVSLGAAQHQT